MIRQLSPTEFERTCHDGELIVREGESGREMFVIQEGGVRVFKQAHDREITLATLQRGDFFGEMSLLEDEARDASAAAIGPTRVLVIQPGGLLLRIRRDPTFAYEMLHRMSHRVRELNAWLIELLERDSAIEGRSAESPGPLLSLGPTRVLDDP